MTAPARIIAFRDHIGQFQPGQIYYPESLKLIVPNLVELHGEDMARPKYFNANLQLFLDGIIRFFEGIHDTHTAAQTTYQQYRAEGRRQYCVYLRSFTLSGLMLNVDIQRNKALLGISGHDRQLRQLLKEQVNDRISLLSFVNTLDIYPPNAHHADYDNAKFTIPSFRVLSHNWRDVVTETIKGAKLIILVLEGNTEGVNFEVQMVRECRMADRAICVIKSQLTHPKSFDDFSDVIALPASGYFEEENVAVRRLRNDIDQLVSDDFTQTNQVRDLSDLKCFVVDRYVDQAASQFAPEILAGVDYTDYVPSSLSTTWNLFAHDYPKMLEHWGKIDQTIAQGGVPGTEDLAVVMYEALGAFLLAVTLERYEEMAFSIGTVGLAHRMITTQSEIMADCYTHAAKCADWGGDSELAKFYQDALAKSLRSSPHNLDTLKSIS